MYWRAFDKADDLDDKLGVVTQADRAVPPAQPVRPAVDAAPAPGARRPARRGRDQPQQQRDVAICMAQAMRPRATWASARAELERLLAANTRDTQLLQQLSKLAEEEGDLESAARYQKQLNELAPSDEGIDTAGAALCALRRAGGSPGGLVEDGRGQERAGIRDLPGDGQPAGAPEAAAGARDHRVDGPQGPARLGGALSAGRGPGGARQARRGGRAVPAPCSTLTITDDEKSAFAKARSRATPSCRPREHRRSSRPTRRRCRWRSGSASIYQIRMRLQARQPHDRRPADITWSPTDFGQARMAALGWLVSLAEKAGPGQGRRGRRRHSQGRREDAGRPPRTLGLVLPVPDAHGQRRRFRGRQAALSRAAPTDPLALWAYLYSLGGRQTAAGSARITSSNPAASRRTTPRRSTRTSSTRPGLLPRAASPPARAGPGPDPPERRRRAEAGQAGRRGGAVLSRGDRRRHAARPDRRRLQPGGPARRRRRPDPALRPLRAAPDRPGHAGTITPARSTSTGPAVALSPGDERPRRPEGVRRRAPAARLRAGRRPPQAWSASPRAPPPAPRAIARLGSRLRPQLPDLGRQDYRRSSDRLPDCQRIPRRDAIQVLRTAYRALQARRPARATWSPTSAARPTRPGRRPTRSIPGWRSARSYWWNDDKDEAIAEFTKVAEASQAESDLRLDLAELLEQQGERADALALADARPAAGQHDA